MELVQKAVDRLVAALCWFFGLFERPEPLPRITNFRWTSADFNEAEATLHYEGGDVRNVYCEGGQWYYFGDIPVTSVRVTNHLSERQLKERWRLQQRQSAGL